MSAAASGSSRPMARAQARALALPRLSRSTAMMRAPELAPRPDHRQPELRAEALDAPPLAHEQLTLQVLWRARTEVVTGPTRGAFLEAERGVARRVLLNHPEPIMIDQLDRLNRVTRDNRGIAELHEVVPIFRLAALRKIRRTRVCDRIVAIEVAHHKLVVDHYPSPTAVLRLKWLRHLR